MECICDHISALYVIPSLHAWPSISFSTVMIASESCRYSLFALFVWVWVCVSFPLYQDSWALFNGVVSVCEVGSLGTQTQALLRGSLCMCMCVCMCFNGIESVAMLEHGRTGGRSCYKTCHFLSSSQQRPILPHFAAIYRALWRARGRVEKGDRFLCELYMEWCVFRY